MKSPATILASTLLIGYASVALAQNPQTALMTDAQVQQKLQSEGYTNVRVTEHDKGHYDVTATKEGKTEKLAVNPHTGAVMPDTDKDD